MVADTLPWAEQFLDQSHSGSVPDLLERVGGLNAQTAYGPLVGIWARQGSWQTPVLDELTASYEVVKINVMRGTVHLLTARQYWAWRPALTPMLRRTVAGFCRGLWDRVDHAELVAWGTDLVSDGQPRTRGDLGEVASRRFPEASSSELGFALRMVLPLVEVPPTSAWQRVRTRYVYAPSVMSGAPAEPEHGLRDLARSFAGAFASTSVEDFCYWSGLTKSEAAPLRAVLAESDGSVDASDTAPTGVLPEFDNIYFCRRASHAPLYAAKKDRRLPPARMPGSLIAQGTVVAHWTASKSDGLRLVPWTDPGPTAMAAWERFADGYRRAAGEPR